MNNKAWGRWSETVGKLGNAAAQAAAENAARCDFLEIGVGTLQDPGGVRASLLCLFCSATVPKCDFSMVFPLSHNCNS
jgi:hypothetical protein